MGFSPTTRAQFLQPGASEIRITWPNPLRPEFCQWRTGDPISGDVGGWYGMVIQFDDFRGIIKKKWDGDDFWIWKSHDFRSSVGLSKKSRCHPKNHQTSSSRLAVHHHFPHWGYTLHVLFPCLFHYSWLMMLMNESKSNHQWKINW